jgi:type II restriction enzyme
MGINADKPSRWKADIARSVDYYNDWFMRYAPVTYRTMRVRATEDVVDALKRTANLVELKPDLLSANPGLLPMLRMMTAPPLARDRLIGLAGVSPPI